MWIFPEDQLTVVQMQKRFPEVLTRIMLGR